MPSCALRSPIPIAAGEAHHTVRDFRALIDGRCIDIVQPSIPGAGGLTEAKRIATLAQAAEPARGAACLGRRGRTGDGLPFHRRAAGHAAHRPSAVSADARIRHERQCAAHAAPEDAAQARGRPRAAARRAGTRHRARSATPSSAIGFADRRGPCQSFARRKHEYSGGITNGQDNASDDSSAGAALAALGLATGAARAGRRSRSASSIR